ncbi:uncharacterized protein LOC108681468 isoform X2 [Hyalella azteca]|uniref:Uncharacterized protein LOC108681468 isoform X2 n=1 Tax=Hyalella azteca TaxID=294128 RepID=A0A8B7PJ30_HYAAZ|nr:uncharacterized protein LOC108681468 isoform X2 [Hyalella azteca]
MIRAPSIELLQTSIQSPVGTNQKSQAATVSGKPKNVTFPKSSMVTFLPELNHSAQSVHTPNPGNNDSTNGKCLRSVGGRGTPHNTKLTPSTLSSWQSHSRDTLGQSPAVSDVLCNGSPSEYFLKLKREDSERTESNCSLSHEEWKGTLPSYFDEQEEAERIKKESVCGANGLSLRPSFNSVTASNSRRYSQVVQQFMQKNGLITPIPDTALVARQADQAKKTDPSYVSWGSVDFGAIEISKLNQTNLSASSETGKNSPGAPLSAESFKVKSAFTPNRSIEPCSTLGNFSNAASYTDAGVNTQSPVLTPVLKDNLLKKTSVSESSSDSGATNGAESPETMDQKKGKKNSLWITPPRRPSSVVGSPCQERVTPVFHASAVRPNRHQVLAISEDAAEEQSKKLQQMKMGAIAMIVLGTVIVIASIIAIIVLMA